MNKERARISAPFLVLATPACAVLGRDFVAVSKSENLNFDSQMELKNFRVVFDTSTNLQLIANPIAHF